jgi:hypothetical protein
MVEWILEWIVLLLDAYHLSLRKLRTLAGSEVIKVSVKENIRLTITLDDAWNHQDWGTFKKRHAGNVAVYCLGQPEPPRERD